uniref:Uncharacterized protein n=1 Tax=Rhizophora mucronata TaxID=61149 RepID=A0A2P2NC74_RHIMU
MLMQLSQCYKNFLFDAMV